LTLKTYFVEDNPTIRENLVSTLAELADVECIGYAAGELDAIQGLSRQDCGWQLAIVDLFLAQGSGLGVLAAVARRAAGRKVVVLSNYATPDMRARCIQLGADVVFDKSNDLEALVDYCNDQGRAPGPDGHLAA